MKSSEIRSTFLDYSARRASRGAFELASWPGKDPTALLVVNSRDGQFKDAVPRREKRPVRLRRGELADDSASARAQSHVWRTSATASPATSSRCSPLSLAITFERSDRFAGSCSRPHVRSLFPPMNTSLNCNHSRVHEQQRGSFTGSSELEGTTAWPFERNKSEKRRANLA